MQTSIPPLLTMISELIATPSITCVDPRLDQSNANVIHILANWCQTMGFDTHVLTVNEQTKKYNLVAQLGSGSGGLMLAGHTDTVPYDENRWHYDPFCLTEVNDHLYGLGTSDMKAFFALALVAASQFQAKAFKQPLLLVATSDEETTMAGAKSLAETQTFSVPQAVIGEPTNLRPIRMHKGIFMEAIRIQGLSGHSSNPAKGNNALEGMHKVITHLLHWREELQQHYQNKAYQVPVPTLNFGHIHGGDNPNRICGECELHIDLRPLPGMPSIAELRTTLQHIIADALAGTGLSFECRSLFDGIEAVETPKEADIVKITEHLTGHQAEAVAFATEAPFLNQLGIHTVILGPGDIAQAHQPNEFIHKARLQPTIDMLTKLIQHFCIEPT